MTSSTKPKTKKIVLGPKRKTIAFREDETVADAMVQLCKELGLSTCHIREALDAAFIHGTKFITNQKDQEHLKTLCLQFPWISYTMNVQVVREVLKARRYNKEYTPFLSEKQVNPCLNFDTPCGETVNELIADY